VRVAVGVRLPTEAVGLAAQAECHWNNESKIIFDATRAIENLIYRYSSQFGTFLHQDREKLRSSTREYMLYVSW